jgi:thiosulfate dehydrogenase [quinone] large subunit
VRSAFTDFSFLRRKPKFSTTLRGIYVFITGMCFAQSQIDSKIQKKGERVMSMERVMIEEPRLARLLFSDTRFAWLWLPLRLYLGYMWFEAGWHKFVDPKWMGSGEALLNYWERGLKMTPKPTISYDWYRGFIEYLVNAEAHTWFSKIIIFGELAIAAALVLGAFVGVAAFFGGLMNWSFIMAGSASTNGMLFAIATWLVLAWRNAGWIGLDRWLLPALGTPWKPGRVFTVTKHSISAV